MVKIRLRRVGAKNQPSYRIVVTDSRSPRDGRFIEKIGFYNPRTEPATMELDEARALHWLSNGAQPSDAVRRIMDKLGTLERLKRLHAGESLEELAAEAVAAREVEPAIDPRTRRDDLVEAKAKSKAQQAKKEPQVEEEAPVEEEEAPVEAEAEAEVEEPEESVEDTDEVAETEAE